MKDLLTFAPGDVCFGKVRGFPAWPARVVALAEESSVKQCKYHVSFFGTGESGLLKADEMHSYFANKIKFTKNVKRKGFQAGLEEIEQYILENNLTPADGELDNTPAEIPVSEVDTPGSDKPKVQKASLKRPALKRLSEPLEKRPRTSVEPTPTSRSGRKIRPKKFSDEFEGDEPLPQGDASDEEPTSKTAAAAADEVGEAEETVLVAPLDSAKPQSPELESTTEDALPKTQTNRTSTGGKSAQKRATVEAPVKRILSKARGVKDNPREEEMKERRKGKLMLVKWFRIEKRLLELDIEIRLNVGLKIHNIEKALSCLEEMGDMTIDPLMLKKHPQVVETVKKLRSYVGNTSCWNLTEEEELMFPQRAEQIRNKAQFVYNRFQSLFIVPPSSTFWQTFSVHVDEFAQKTNGWNLEVMYELTHEPTDADIERVNKALKTPEATRNGSAEEYEASPPEEVSPSSKEKSEPKTEESAVDSV